MRLVAVRIAGRLMYGEDSLLALYFCTVRLAWKIDTICLLLLNSRLLESRKLLLLQESDLNVIS